MYEIVSTFEDTWVECLGDLGHYRMAIGDSDAYDLGVWASVSGSWYSKVADKTPHVGHLHHHLAILAELEPDILVQLFYYCKSLGVTDPFHLTREASWGYSTPYIQSTLPPAELPCRYKVYPTTRHKFYPYRPRGIQRDSLTTPTSWTSISGIRNQSGR